MKARHGQGRAGEGANKLHSDMSGTGYCPSPDQPRLITGRGGKAGKDLLESMSVSPGRKQPYTEPGCDLKEALTPPNPQQPSPTVLVSAPRGRPSPRRRAEEN